MIIGKLPKELLENKILFITGTDTNVGKTYAVGNLAKYLKENGVNVITQKLIQTGCKEFSEDVEMHRDIAGMEFTEDDKNGITSPIVLSYPSSPHLAAEIDNEEIDFDKIEEYTKILTDKYDIVLLEGAGGLMVPFTSNQSDLGGYLVIDYIKDHNYPVVLVTSGKLGSINHTLLSIDACKQRGIEIGLIIYNLYPTCDNLITTSTLKYLKNLGIPVALLSNSEEEE